MKTMFIVLTCILFACKDRTERNKELWAMMRSENIGKIVSATEEIRKAHDTSMIEALLYRAEDPRVMTSLSYKGRSVYQIKMEALKEITGLIPPAEITYEVDTSIIQFYHEKFSKY